MKVSSSDLIGRPPRVVLAKPGMDGHNRGVRVVARILIDAGCEVIYLGIRRTAREIALAAATEDADVVGLSLLSGAHIALCADVRHALDEMGLNDIPIVCGGIIPIEDHEILLKNSVVAVFTPGASASAISATVLGLCGPETSDPLDAFRASQIEESL
jgi:methylmalonyl-CoA mutase C-terminal domain/subunit